MSTFVFMKVLESAPERYDRGMRWLSGGAIAGIHESIAGRVAAPGERVLDLGTGTGALALACARRGAEVVAIDAHAGMLEVARRKAAAASGPGSAEPDVEWLELSAMELEDRFPTESFDAVVTCLMLSELWPVERAYVLRTAFTLLRPGGLLVAADEVLPETATGRLLRRIRRAPLSALTYLFTQTTTRALPEPVALLREAGFTEVTEERVGRGDFAIVTGRRRKAAA